MIQDNELRQVLVTADEETRRRALSSLVDQPLAEIEQFLFLAMADESWRVRKEAVDLYVAAVPSSDSVFRLLELLRNEENAGLRNSAAEAVIRLGDSAADCLITMCGDEDPDVRKFIIDAMGCIGSRAFVPCLLAALADRVENVAAAAAEQLGNVGDMTVVPQLIDSIIDNHSLIYRFSALAALARLNACLPVPEGILRLAEQEILRQSVLNCLGNIGDESVVGVLMSGFSSRQRNSRKAAVASWYRLYCRVDSGARQRMEQALRIFDRDVLMPVLIEQFTLLDPHMAEAVTVMLGIVGDRRAVNTLLNAWTCERISHLALGAMKMLEPSGIESLISLYDNADVAARTAICTVIGELANANGSVIIGQGLNDGYPTVRCAAVKAAGMLGVTAFIPDIVRLLGDADSQVRNAAVACMSALSRLDRTSILDVARKLAHSEVPDHRRDAAVLAAELSEGDYLSRLVKDEDPSVRKAAVASLGRLNTIGVGSMLQMALVDECPDVRIAAVESLASIGGRPALDCLIPALHDSDTWVQCAVLKGIEKIDRASLLQAIAELFPAAGGLLMITCLEMLGKIGSEEALALVSMAQDNPDGDISRLARSIIDSRCNRGA
ncbi:MAG TPA: HEAT repeat domain-containing protein [Deltaproteobacteria bacterium]|nr:HEAT repeat domain-containing protein [Deltaproteobacteria bacterium]HQB37830.1 HEAT repeat domain-containing protein [Deltaproteobacteria bacterium]